MKKLKFIKYLILILSVVAIMSTFILTSKIYSNSNINMEVSASTIPSDAIDLGTFTIGEEGKYYNAGNHYTADGALDDAIDNYLSGVTNFKISNKAGLINFAKLCSNYFTAYVSYHGVLGLTTRIERKIEWKFQDQNVYLDADIDMNGEALCIAKFSGTFYGGYHKISNISRNSYNSYYYGAPGVVTTSGLVDGIFGETSYATIKDLKIDQCIFTNITGAASYAGGSYWGTLAGCSHNSTFENCMLENIVINYDDNYSPFNEINFLVGQDDNTSIKNCTFKNIFLYYGRNRCYFNSIGTDSSNTKIAINDVSYINDSTGYERILSSDISNKGGPDEKEPIYRCEDYDGGFCQIRGFLSWKTIIFTCSNNAINISPSAIYVPQSFNKTYTSNSATITVADRAILATSSNTNVGITGWTCNGICSYTCNIRNQFSVNINLYNPYNVEQNYYHSNNIFAVFDLVANGNSYTDLGNEPSSFTVFENESVLIKNIKIKTDCSTFYLSAEENSPTLNYDPEAYYISQIKVNGEDVTNSFYANEILSTIITQTTEINIYFGIKTYNIVFN